MSRVLNPMSSKVRASLSRVLDDLGDSLLQVVAGTPGRASNIDGIVIYDRADEFVMPAKAIVLGVGVHTSAEINDLLFELGRIGATALVVRAPVDEGAELSRAVRRSGVALLSLTKGASWAQLAAMLRTILSENDVSGEGSSTLGGMPSGDLFALANAVASLLDAPVTIEDRNFNVLAYSSGQDVADASRIETILGRQVPARLTEALEASGTIADLYKNAGELYLQPDALDSEEKFMLRVAVAVRAGDEVLGSMWAAVPERLNEERTQAFLDSAKLVALHMLRRRAGADVERRLRNDLVATALEGSTDSPEALGRLGLIGQETTVVAVALTADESLLPDIGVASRSVADHQRLADAFAVHLGAVSPGSAVALLGDVAYGLIAVPATGDAGEDRAKRILTSFFGRLGSRFSAVAGVGSSAKDASQLGRSRIDADRALRVLRHRGARDAVSSISDVYIPALMMELGDIAVARGDRLSGPVAKLRDYDEAHNSSLLETLECWLDAFGDVAVAASAAFVHTNTFRYRLKRMAEVAELDLSSPDDRFAAMLQMRLMAGSYLSR